MACDRQAAHVSPMDNKEEENTTESIYIYNFLFFVYISRLHGNHCTHAAYKLKGSNKCTQQKARRELFLDDTLLNGHRPSSAVGEDGATSRRSWRKAVIQPIPGMTSL